MSMQCDNLLVLIHIIWLHLRPLLHIIERVSYGSLVGYLSCFLNKLVVDSRLYEGPRAGAAALAAVGERCGMRDLGCLFH